MGILALVCVLSCSVAVVVVGQSSSCRDKVDYYTCYNWSVNGMCTEPSYRQLAMQNCRRTCNMCWDTWASNDVANTDSSSSSSSNNNNNNNDNGEKCEDNRTTCSKWKKHCRHNSAYYEFMTENCRRTCGFCVDETCADINKRCEKYKKKNYCDIQHMYHAFMKKNCELTCKLCRPPTKNVKPKAKSPLNSQRFRNLKKEFLCDFEVDECDWINQPFDDTADWSIGRNENGPAKGFKSSNGYLYLAGKIYEGYYANLLLPWQLILPDGVTSLGKMCLHFMYMMNDGKLTVSQRGTPTSRNKFPPTVVKFTNEKPTLRWKHATVDVMVTDSFELVIKGRKGVRQSYLAIDYLFFTKGGCY